jgi:leucyl-tRNA synthetase
MLVDDEVELPVQLNGKVRHRLKVPAEAEPKRIEELVMADGKLRELLGDKPVRKVVVVPGRMINIVHG